jgi:hypothetical protein
MDPVKSAELVVYGRYAVAPLIAAADVSVATRVSFERHTIQGLGAQL